MTSGAGPEKGQSHYRCHPTMGTPSMFEKATVRVSSRKQPREVSPVVLLSLQVTLPSCRVATKEAGPQASCKLLSACSQKPRENPGRYRKQPGLEWSSRWSQGLVHRDSVQGLTAGRGVSALPVLGWSSSCAGRNNSRWSSFPSVDRGLCFCHIPMAPDSGLLSLFSSLLFPSLPPCFLASRPPSLSSLLPYFLHSQLSSSSGPLSPLMPSRFYWILLSCPSLSLRLAQGAAEESGSPQATEAPGSETPGEKQWQCPPATQGVCCLCSCHLGIPRGSAGWSHMPHVLFYSR